MDALIEGTIGLHKTELITAQRFWTGRGQVERETAEWVRWFNTVLRKASRLLMHKGIHTRQVAPLEGRISLWDPR